MSWIVGCPPSSLSSFISGSLLNQNQSKSDVEQEEIENDDFDVTEYNSTPLGIYSENCGLDQVHLTFGPEEYAFHWIVKNSKNGNLENGSSSYDIEEASFVMRYSRLYIWLHSDLSDHQQQHYSIFESENDLQIKELVRLFNEGLSIIYSTLFSIQLQEQQSSSNKISYSSTFQTSPFNSSSSTNNRNQEEEDLKVEEEVEFQNIPDINEIWPYYEDLILRYLGKNEDEDYWW